MFFLWGLGAIVAAMSLVAARGIYLAATGKDYKVLSHFKKVSENDVYIFFQIEVGRVARKSRLRTAFLKSKRYADENWWRTRYVQAAPWTDNLTWVEDGQPASGLCKSKVRQYLSQADRLDDATKALDVMIDGMDTSDHIVEELKKARKEIEVLKKQSPYDEDTRRVRIAGRLVPEEQLEDILMERGLKK